MLFWGAFLVPVAHADTTLAPVIVSQEIDSVLSAQSTPGEWYQELTPTNAVASTSAGVSGHIDSAMAHVFVYNNGVSPLNLDGLGFGVFTDAGGCVFYPQGLGQLPPGSSFDDTVLYDVPDVGNGSNCDIFPNERVVIQLTTVGSGLLSVYGSPGNEGYWHASTDWTDFTPNASRGTADNNVENIFFRLNGPGVVIGPSIGSTGLGTSTVQAYCAANNVSDGSFFGDLSNGVSYAMCAAFATLFVPSQTVLNNFSSMANTAKSKVPFSYYTDFSTALTAQSASSTANFSVLSLDLRGTGVASTSPWRTVLPSSFSYLSSTTITTYVPSPLYSLLFLLMRSAIWIAVLFHVYHRLVPRHATHASS